MAKKIIKKTFGGIGKLIGGGKKKDAAPAPVEGQPIVTPLDGFTTAKKKDRRGMTAQSTSSILTDKLGADGRSWKLGG